MATRRLAVFVFVFLVLFSGCGGQEQRNPSYIAPILVANSDGDVIGMANCILVDGKLGLVATNAHVVHGASIFFAKFSSQWYRLEKTEAWVNWNADVAILKVRFGDGISVPREAFLSEAYPDIGSKTFVNGYKYEQGIPKVRQVEDFIKNRPKFKTFEMAAKVERVNSDLGVTLMSRLRILEVKIKIFKGEKIQDHELPILYQDYTIIERKYYDDRFAGGMSGSPVVDSHQQVVGILSAANEYIAAVVPAYEIKRLMEKAIKNLRGAGNLTPRFHFILFLLSYCGWRTT